MKFPAFYTAQNFIIIFVIAWNVFYPEPDESNPHHPTFFLSPIFKNYPAF